jgi:hypothetical protein
MAVFALLSCRVEINSVDMSARVAAVELPIDADDLDTTNFGSAGWRERIAGLAGGTMKVKFNDDFAASTVDDLLWARFRLATAVNVRPTNGAISATNPEWQFSVIVNSFTFVAGSVGALATKDLTWPITGAVTRDTTP